MRSLSNNAEQFQQTRGVRPKVFNPYNAQYTLFNTNTPHGEQR